MYVALFAFPFTSGLGAGAALFLLVAGGIGMSAPVQGGIGTYHLLVSQGLVLYGVVVEDGLAFAFMLHGLQLILVIVLGITSLFLLFSVRKNKQESSVLSKNLRPFPFGSKIFFYFITHSYHIMASKRRRSFTQQPKTTAPFAGATSTT
jgi:hypothetical protein